MKSDIMLSIPLFQAGRCLGLCPCSRPNKTSCFELPCPSGEAIQRGMFFLVNPKYSTEAGFPLPVFISQGIANKCETVTPAIQKSGKVDRVIRSRIWKMLTGLQDNINDGRPSGTIIYDVSLGRAKKSSMTLKASIERGPNGEPCILLAHYEEF